MAAAMRRGWTRPGGDTAATACRAPTGLTRVVRLLVAAALVGCALLVVALLGGGVAAARDQASAVPPAGHTTLGVLRAAVELERGGAARARTDPATLQAVARLYGWAAAPAVATGGGPADAALGLLPDGRGGPIPPGQSGDATRPRWEHGLSRVWAAVAGAPGEAGDGRGGSPDGGPPEGGSPGAGRLAGAGLTLAQAARPAPGPYGTVDGIVDRVAGQAGALAARVAEFAADHANLLAASQLSRRAERLTASVKAHAGDARAGAKRNDLGAARTMVDAAIGDLEQLIRLVKDVTPVVRDRAGELFDQEAGLAGLGVEDLRQQIGSYGRHARQDDVDVAKVAAAAAGVARQLADATTRAAADHREMDVWWPAADVWWAADDARYHAWNAALSQTWPMRWIMSPARTHALRAVDALETAATLAQVSAYRWGREGRRLELAAGSAELMLDAARRGARGLGRGAGLEPGATTTADAARDEGEGAVVADPAASATAERALTAASALAQPARDKPALGDLGDRVASQATVLAAMTTRLAGGQVVVTDPQDRDPHGVAASVGAHVDAARTHERREELSLARASLDRAIGDLEILSDLAAWVAGRLDGAGEGLHSVAEGASGGVEVNRLAFDSYGTFADRPPKSAERVAGTLVADARTLVGLTRRYAGDRGGAELTELTEEVEARATNVERYGTFPWRLSPWRLFASPAAVREAAHRAIHAYDRLTVYADSLAYRLKREASGLNVAGGSARALAGEARRRADERMRGAGLDAPEGTTAAALAGGGEDGDTAAGPAAGAAPEPADVPGAGPEPATGAALAAADPLTGGHAGPGDSEADDGEADDVASGFASTPGGGPASTVTEGTGSGTGSPMPDGDGLPAADASIDAGDAGFTGNLFG
jgi:hypothetical protein